MARHVCPSGVERTESIEGHIISTQTGSKAIDEGGQNVQKFSVVYTKIFFWYTDAKNIPRWSIQRVWSANCVLLTCLQFVPNSWDMNMNVVDVRKEASWQPPQLYNCHFFALTFIDSHSFNNVVSARYYYTCLSMGHEVPKCQRYVYVMLEMARQEAGGRTQMQVFTGKKGKQLRTITGRAETRHRWCTCRREHNQGRGK